MQNIVCHLENPDKMYKIINVKDIQTCNNSMSVCVPRNQAEEVLSICTSMRTTTVPLIVPGRLQSSMQQCRQQGNLRCVWPWQLHLQKDGRSGNMYRTQERSGFCQWQWSVSDIDSQTVTKSMSSLKTTMKDRLVIVMRYICTYYDAYSFEKKLYPCILANLEIIPMITHTNASEDTATPFGSPGTLWTVSITKLWWNTSTCHLGSFVRNSCPVHLQTTPRFAQN